MKKLRATIEPPSGKRQNQQGTVRPVYRAGRQDRLRRPVVERTSPIPNEDGVRLDVIQAYRDIQVPLLHWPGGGVLIPTIGWTASALRRKESP